jgi:class 3 adenylate cyclase/tetratricopeptide (TPR) repeat protein
MIGQCPACAAELSQGMRFCPYCGTAVAAALGSSPRERRLVSVLFCDLVGFTSFSESRDAEDVRDMLEMYFSIARRVVILHDGQIEKFMGDAVMAVWGTPVAREDDAERAIRTGLQLVEGVSQLGERFGITALAARVGVVTGEAAVNLASVAEGMVIGDAVNTASRIQSLAEPGTLLVDETTRRICADAVTFRDAGAHQVKGKSEPVQTWQVLALQSAAVELSGTGSARIEPPFIGRDSELTTAIRPLTALEDADCGLQLVTILGDAGLGKSRLVRELERRAHQHDVPVRWYSGRALSFGEGNGFHALAEIFAGAAGFSVSDPPERRRDGIEALLAATLADAAERRRVRPALARLFDLDDDGAGIERGELFSAWRLLVSHLARAAPLVIALDGLHFASQDLLDFLAHLQEWAGDEAILVLAQSRPDTRVQALAARGQMINLMPLSAEQIGELVAGAVREPPPDLIRAIVADGGGVPLYAVESLRSLADQGVLISEGSRYVVRGEVNAAHVPPTIRALVAARLDLLAPEARRLVSAAAVLGDRFVPEAAAELAHLDVSDARSAMSDLRARAILEATAGGDAEFVQGVVRRVALANLSRRDRKRLCLAAAELLGADHRHEPAMTAGYLLEALAAAPSDPDVVELRERAGKTLIHAAERAVDVGSIEEALVHLDRARECSDDPEASLALLAQSAAVAWRGGLGPESAQRWATVRDAHAAAGRTREALLASLNHLRTGRYVGPPADLLPGLREIDAALAGVKDATAAQAATTLAFTLYQCGDHVEALANARRAVAIAEVAEAPGDLVQALGTEAIALGELGRLTEALSVYDRAIELAEPHDSRRLTELVGNRAMTLGSVARFSESAAGARDTIALAERQGMRFTECWARLVLARALCAQGDWDAAETEVEAAGDNVQSFQLGMAYAPQVMIALARGELAAAAELAADFDARRAGAAVHEPDFSCLRAAVLAAHRGDKDGVARVLAEGKPADFAEWSSWVPAAVDLLVAGGIPDAAWLRSAHAALTSDDEPTKRLAPVAAQARRLEAWLALDTGDLHAAREAWGQALSLARSCGMTGAAAVIAAEESSMTARWRGKP